MYININIKDMYVNGAYLGNKSFAFNIERHEINLSGPHVNFERK